MSLDINRVVKLIDEHTGELVSYTEVTTYADGQPMTDALVDNVIYRKGGGSITSVISPAQSM